MRFDIKTVSEMNMREHWHVKHKRKLAQQADFHNFWLVAKCCHALPVVTFPATITFTRFSCKELDQDNLAGSFKHIQDQLARELGIDDGDGSVQWKYEQERIKKREHYFTVEIQEV